MTWDERWISLAEHVSQWSKDQSTKVGAVIVDSRNSVLSLGWNGMPRGVDDSINVREIRPQKYFYTEHAERNAIFNGAATGQALLDSIIYCTMFPCAECARSIIQSGITTLITHKPIESEQWADSFAASRNAYRSRNRNKICQINIEL